MSEIKETVWEFVQGEATGTFSTAQSKWINKIHRLKAKYPDQVDIRAENNDGSLVVHIPEKWFKISPPKKVSEEFKQAASERMKLMQSQSKDKI